MLKTTYKHFNVCVNKSILKAYQRKGEEDIDVNEVKLLGPEPPGTIPRGATPLM